MFSLKTVANPFVLLDVVAVKTDAQFRSLPMLLDQL
jgi:hypothetical protein